jgi:hypothetical protein
VQIRALTREIGLLALLEGEPLRGLGAAPVLVLALLSQSSPGGGWKSDATSRRVCVVKNRSHRNRNKTARYRAKLKAKHRRTRLRRSHGERSTYR